MPRPFENQRSLRLQKLAAERWGSIDGAETQVLKLSASIDQDDPQDSGKRPEVRPDFLRWLMTDKEAISNIDPLGVRVHNATIPKDLHLNFCKIPFPLRMWYCTLKGDLRVQWAELPYIQLNECVVESGFYGDSIHTLGGLDLLSCEINGQVSLTTAQIDGNLDCSRSKLRGILNSPNEANLSINADGAKISGSVYLINRDNQSFSAEGKLSMIGTQITGVLNCSGAQLAPAGGDPLDEKVAIDAGGLKARGLFLRDHFSVVGTILLVGTDVDIDLDCSFADRLGAFKCDQMRVGQRLILTDIRDMKDAEIFLTGVSVGSFHDDEKSWPTHNNLHLNGFEYRQFFAHEPATKEQERDSNLGAAYPLNIEKRIKWIRLQPPDDLKNAQPWMQFAKYLESMGNTEGAKRVRYEFHRERASDSYWRPLSYVYDKIEEQPLRVLLPIAAFWTLGSLIFWRANRMNAMKPTTAPPATTLDQPPSAQTPAAATAPPHIPPTPPFNPCVYSLENVLPVVKLGQDGAWAPDPATKGTLLPDWRAFRSINRVAARWKFTRWVTELNYTRLALLRWVLILLGWVLALVLASAIGEQFKH